MFLLGACRFPDLSLVLKLMLRTGRAGQTRRLFLIDILVFGSTKVEWVVVAVAVAVAVVVVVVDGKDLIVCICIESKHIV